jgi:hypothetical protein
VVSAYVNKNNGFHQAEILSRECPHCGALAQLLPLAPPSFAAIVAAAPKHVGIAFACAACKEPRFVRTAVRRIDAEQIELSAQMTEIERPREKFPYQYLPAGVEPLFREALECYAAGCSNAFASMCRRTVDAILTDTGPQERLRCYELFKDVARLGEIDDETAQILESVLFGPGTALPGITADQAAVLIEVVKDILYQAYVRTAKLRAAMKVRRFFAGEHASKITSIDRQNRRLESA